MFDAMQLLWQVFYIWQLPSADKFLINPLLRSNHKFFSGRFSNLCSDTPLNWNWDSSLDNWFFAKYYAEILMSEAVFLDHH